MAANNPKDKSLSTNSYIVVVALVSVIVLVFSFYLGRILWAQLKLNNKVISKKSVAADTLKKDLTAADQLDQNYKNLGGDVALIDAALPTSQEFDDLITTFNAMAGQSGVTLASINNSSSTSSAAPAAAAPAASGPIMPSSFQVTATLNGNYDSLIKFLAASQLSARPLVATSLSLNGVTGAMTATVTYNTYYMDKADLSIKTETVSP